MSTNTDWSFIESLKPTANADDPDFADVQAVPYAHPPQPPSNLFAVDKAFEQLRIERTRLHDAQTTLSVKQDAYDDCKRDMILGGHVVGKNETERDAKLSDLLRVQIAQLRDAQRAERTARLYYDIAQDNVKRLAMLTALVHEA